VPAERAPRAGEPGRGARCSRATPWRAPHAGEPGHLSPLILHEAARFPRRVTSPIERSRRAGTVRSGLAADGGGRAGARVRSPRAADSAPGAGPRARGILRPRRSARPPPKPWYLLLPRGDAAALRRPVITSRSSRDQTVIDRAKMEIAASPPSAVRVETAPSDRRIAHRAQRARPGIPRDGRR